MDLQQRDAPDLMLSQSWVFDEILASVAAALGVSGVGVTVVSTRRDRLQALGTARGLGRGPVDALREHVSVSRSTLVVTDTLATPASGVRFEGTTTARFLAAEPLLAADGAVVGALCLWDDEPRVPSAEQVATMGRAARILGLMIEHATDAEARRPGDAGARDRAVLAATGSVLSQIVEGAPLSGVLDSLARAVESAQPDTLCSVLLLEGDVLRHGAAPSLPVEFMRAIDGATIGPDIGSCGTAAYRGSTVVVGDIAHDELWKNYADLALPHGLQACWSLPIIAPGGGVLGTFALYFREPRTPAPGELEALRQWVNLAQLAILRSRDLTRLRTAATRDPVTGLLNRAEMTRRIRSDVVEPACPVAAVLFVDLDGFKLVNDTFGHHVGDEVLRRLAERIQACCGDRQVPSRWGGDEFVIYSRATAAVSAALALAEEVVDAVHRPMRVRGHTLSLSASVGVATSDTSVPADLVADADLAMYTAKHSARSSVALFSTELRGSAARRLRLEADLSVALANNEIFCVYQPCVELSTGNLVGVEALARWTSPIMGSVPPVTFVPVAEEAGLIGKLGRLVLNEACRQLADWRATERRWDGIRTWVNVSPRQLEDDRLPAVVDRALLDSGLDYCDLGIEVTESSFVRADSTSQSMLTDLRERGVQVAIDDFGTGFSSLSQLKNLPVDVLKIDRQFVVDMDSAHDTRMIRAILAFADSLGLSVVVEGIETTEQRRQLLEFSSPLAQGYMWSKPVSGTDLAAWVTRRPGVSLN